MILTSPLVVTVTLDDVNRAHRTSFASAPDLVPPRAGIDLVLGMPRPKQLKRVLADEQNEVLDTLRR